MKILLITARFYPEPFTITRMAENLATRGHELTVLTGRPNSGAWKVYPGYENVKTEDYKGIKIIRVREIPRKQGVFGLSLNYLSIFFLYKKALHHMKGDFDIVFSHVMSPIFVLSGVAKFCKKRKIPHFHYGFDLWPESLVASGYFKRNSLVFKAMKKASAKCYGACDEITFASPCVENYFKDYLGVPVKFKHIYQPCLTELPPLEFVESHEYKLDGKLHILFCGTIAQFNHLELFIEALNDEEIKNRCIFDIVGSGSAEEEIRKLVQKAGLLGTVVFHGRVTPERTKGYYQKADVLFVPLFFNSATSLMIPQKVIEYFMYSRTIFGMIKGDGAALIEEASSLNVISDQNVASLRKGLKTLISMPISSLSECGRENRRFLEGNSRFTLNTICDEIETEMEALVRGCRDND